MTCDSSTPAQEHFFFRAWPDHDAPTQTAPCIAMLEAVNNVVAERSSTAGNVKVIVHCRCDPHCAAAGLGWACKLVVDCEHAHTHTHTRTHTHTSLIRLVGRFCSAGVGRTGTYIALDHCLHELRTTGHTDPLTVIRNIRNDRCALVQHQVQFVYLHQ
jgi:protein tyrosine phosphatase